jgi:quinol monooxygenase YgiN
MDGEKPVFLLSIQGILSPKTLEAAREVHNRTARAPANVAAARQLSDLSHMVYVPLGGNGHAGDFLILDLWNNMDGLNKFFSDPHVQEGGGLIFGSRDPVVWTPAGLVSYNFPAPYEKNDRIVATVRAKVKSLAEASQYHNALVQKLVNKARIAGNMSHTGYYRMAAPGDPAGLEFFAVDTWFDAAGMAKHYQNPEVMEGFGDLFSVPPALGVWVHPAGEWVEW